MFYLSTREGVLCALKIAPLLQGLLALALSS